MLTTVKHINDYFIDRFGELYCQVSRFILTLPFLFACLVLFSHEGMANDLSQPDALVAHFDTGVSFNGSPNLTFEKHGGRIVRNGIKGGALHLASGEYLTIDANKVIEATGGTVMFWLKPNWGYYNHKGSNLISHTFASFSWSDGGYFALSDGWWEPAGMYHTYFIQNNINLTHANSKIIFRKDQWLHIAVTWAAGYPGFVNLYADGKLVSSNVGDIKIENPVGKLFLGSDLGTSLSNHRWADSDIDELYIYKEPLSEQQIQNSLRLQDARWKEQKYDWMKRIITKSPSALQTLEKRGLETRAIFDEGPGAWNTERNTRQLIKRIKRAGFNVYVPCVWHGDGTRYPSKLAPPAKYIAPGDALETLIKLAHENGIEVHPWFTVAYRSRDFLHEYYDDGSIENSFDIFRPKFRDFMVNLILDVVKRYDVDGINLDYIRTMGVPHSDFAINAYRKEYGRDLLQDEHKFGSRGDIEPHLKQFSDNAVKDIVSRVSQQARRIKPNLIISVDGHPVPRLMLPSDQGRQEIEWANAGLVDVIYAMDYEKNPDLDGFDLASEELHDPGKLIMLTSDYDEISGVPISRSPEEFANLVALVQKKWNRGVGVYLYSMLTDEQIDSLSEGPFKYPAKPNWWKAGSQNGL